MGSEAFHTILSSLEHKNNVELHLSLRDGNILDVVDFHIKNDKIIDNSGNYTLLDDINYIEVSLL